ncbi:MAG TPA: SIS domain-containing protein [Solirubrobacteraceae bacterium]|nr:SIS domain-containing protein [Solirubrobacteraceae bacterium]
MSILHDEIAEQPAVLERLLGTIDLAPLTGVLRVRPPRFALIAARGSSDNVARYAQHVLGRLCGIPVALATPSLHTLYHAPPRLHDALVIGISQSWAAPDVTAVVRDAAQQGQVTLAITNDPRSPLATAAEHVIELGTGQERSIAATKTYTASLAAVAALAAALAQDRDRHAELATVPPQVAAQLEKAVDVDIDWQRCAVIGRGANYATAFEAALKVKELTGIAAEPYSPPDLMHGPVAVLGPDHGLLAFAPPGPAERGVREAVEEARHRGAPALVAAPGGDLDLVPMPEWLSPLGAVIPAQRLAAATAERRGIDVDRPFGLHKITRTT